MEQQKKIPSGHAIVEVLRAEGVRCVFGIPGGHVLGIYDALYRANDIKSYLMRHEQAAASMASAYYQLTGEVAVCITTAGPGTTNLLSGIAEAAVGSIPIVVLSGRGATATRHRGASQEIDTDRIYHPITKMSVRVDRADLLVDVVRQAFAVARNGRPGPVLVDIPRDLLTETVTFGPYVPVGAPARPRADAEAVARAAEMLATAELPIVVAGGGVVASDAFAAVRELAECLAIPVLTSLAGRGSIPDDHPLSVGGLGAHRNRLSKRLLKEADVVLALGARFEEMETNWRPGFVPSPGARTIQVDIEPGEIGRSIAVALGIVGDVRATVEEIVGRLRANGRALAADAWRDHPRTRACAEELAEIAGEIAATAASAQSPIHPLRVIRAVRAAFPEDATIGFDVGCIAQHMAGSQPVFPIYRPRSVIAPSSFYGMGFVAMGLPAARIAHPDRPAACFVGDGSFQMALHILPAAAEYGLAVTWIVLNDHALGSIRDIQEFGFGNRIIDTDYKVEPDFAAIARACGCHGETVTAADDLEAAIGRAVDANRRGIPALLDVSVARERMQQTYDHYLVYGKAQP